MTLDVQLDSSSGRESFLNLPERGREREREYRSTSVEGVPCGSLKRKTRKMVVVSPPDLLGCHSLPFSAAGRAGGGAEERSSMDGEAAAAAGGEFPRPNFETQPFA